jgi:hypothetical protein
MSGQHAYSNQLLPKQQMLPNQFVKSVEKTVSNSTDGRREAERE